jgi:hypothetical protein
LLPAFERLEHDHMSTTAWAWRASLDWLNRFGIIWWRCDVEQPAGERNAGLARGCGEQPVMPNAVEPARQDGINNVPAIIAGGQLHFSCQT